MHPYEVDMVSALGADRRHIAASARSSCRPHGQTQHGVQRARSLVVLSPILVFELQEPRFSLRIDQDVSQSQPPLADRSLR